MKKEEIIERYGKAAYQKKLEQSRAWDEAHPQEVLARQRETDRKGGIYYDKKLIYQQTGIRGERSIIRATHGKQYRQYKKIIAPGSQIHHAWRSGTSEYPGVALVEADQHMHGFIDVIEILEGDITIFTEKEIREQ